MADLYDRLDEIQGMVRTLLGDLRQLGPVLGDRSPQAHVADEQAANRRFYVRAIFALIEAVIEQHKRLLLDLTQRKVITLETGVSAALSETIYVVRDNGSVTAREQYLQMQRKLRAVYRAAEAAFGQPMNMPFGDQGWASFQTAVAIRDRITHPKTFQDCDISGADLDEVDRGHEWFKAIQNSFVALARAHRTAHQW
jgi:hypothetical protein